MNIFTFLTSRRGAISKAGAVSLILTGTLVGAHFYNYVSSNQAAQDRKVRNLASIMREGGNLGPYSKIRVSAGNAQFATPEERAKYEGSFLNNLDASENAVESFTIQGRTFGPGEVGLGMGGVDYQEIGTGGSAGTDATDISGVGNAVRNQARQNGGSNQTFERASIPHVNGNSFDTGTFGSGTTGASSGTRGGSADRGSRIMPSGVSGNMPRGSSNLVSTKGLQGAHASSYRNSNGSRGGSTNRGEEGRGLRRIAVNSGKAAADQYRRTNAGVDPLMNDQYETPGLTVTGDAQETLSQGGTGNDSFNKTRAMRMRKLGSSMEELKKTEEERSNDSGRLWMELVGLLCATFVAMLAIRSLTQAGGAWGWIGAAAVAAVMALALGLFVRDAIDYGKKWSEWGLPTGMFIGAGVMALGIASAFIGKLSGWLDKVAEFLDTKFGSLIESVFGGQGTATVEQMAQQDRIGSKDESNLSNQ